MKQIMDAQAMSRSLVRMTHEIIERNKGVDNIVLVGIVTRGAPLARRIASLLQKYENQEVEVVELDTNAWRDDLQQDVEKPKLNINITGKDVILVDDVLQSGRTIRAAMDAIIEFGRPQSIQLAILVDRGHRELPIRPDYIGKNIPTAQGEFVRVRVSECDGVDEVIIDSVKL